MTFKNSLPHFSLCTFRRRAHSSQETSRNNIKIDLVMVVKSPSFPNDHIDYFCHPCEIFLVDEWPEVVIISIVFNTNIK